MRTFVCAAVGLCLALASPAAAQERPRQITVTGTAEIEAVPDLATITAGVETRGADAAAALAANSTAMASVHEALEQAGIALRDIQTSQLNLSPVYDNQPSDANAPPDVVAYSASNMVTIRVRNVSGLGAAVDAITGAGANRLYGINFDVSDPRPALDRARQSAVADARAKAELYARAAGVTLGPLVTLSESAGGPSPAPYRAKMDMAAAPPIAAGTVTLDTQVEMVFAIN